MAVERHLVFFGDPCHFSVLIYILLYIESGLLPILPGATIAIVLGYLSLSCLTDSSVTFKACSSETVTSSKFPSSLNLSCLLGHVPSANPMPENCLIPVRADPSRFASSAWKESTLGVLPIIETAVVVPNFILSAAASAPSLRQNSLSVQK